MAVRITIANHKGGVAKSTTAMMLADGLALRGHRVLVFDLDPQGMVSRLLLGRSGVASAVRQEKTIGHLLEKLISGKPAQLARYQTPGSDLAELREPNALGRVDVVASDDRTLVVELARLEDALRALASGERLDVLLWRLLEPQLAKHDRNYDVVIFDTPAGTPPLALTALRLSTHVIAPTNLEENSFSTLMVFLRIVLADELGLAGTVRVHVLPTMFLASNPEQVRFLDYIRTSTPEVNAFPRPIPHTVAIHRAEAHPGPGAFRRSREKYDSAISDVQALAEAVEQRIIKR
ncbi:MAG: ParA family protein [Hyphomicrobiaceae bacterium]|nr:ParA family protein [Hyphomicrobiaceae bacterium]